MTHPTTRFAILLGGDLVVTPRLLAQVEGARVIAADSGMRHAAGLGVAPELWTGDFDSVDEAMRAEHSATPVEEFPRDKDKTDGEIAVQAALKRGARELLLVGAFGGARADHAFLHLAAAMRLAESGVGCLLTSGVQEGVPLLVGKDRSFDYDDGTLFSVLPFSELNGLTISGAKWPLTDHHVPFGSSLTLSNEVRGTLTARLASGRALLVAHPVSSFSM
ncbi:MULTISPECIES: thiamine diphosphokinase [unclassified Aminobacter]|uniref:thiamine diphosphokinase n=1 Tax=unclassified Aminobacter TaxID=2644704 RepID=UPI000462F054|nr:MULTISPECIES: thiamine diphosphokinase [unclassified Aminobacter]TWG65011.1 thiamine pyrophosphokinase [Aminobacter sp. J44]TWH30433.1 thiamine pyrophosphokinase [Aminobacter sp. J15]